MEKKLTYVAHNIVTTTPEQVRQAVERVGMFNEYTLPAIKVLGLFDYNHPDPRKWSSISAYDLKRMHAERNPDLTKAQSDSYVNRIIYQTSFMGVSLNKDIVAALQYVPYRGFELNYARFTHAGDIYVTSDSEISFLKLFKDSIATVNSFIPEGKPALDFIVFRESSGRFEQAASIPGASSAYEDEFRTAIFALNGLIPHGCCAYDFIDIGEDGLLRLAGSMRFEFWESACRSYRLKRDQKLRSEQRERDKSNNTQQ